LQNPIVYKTLHGRELREARFFNGSELRSTADFLTQPFVDFCDEPSRICWV